MISTQAIFYQIHTFIPYVTYIIVCAVVRIIKKGLSKVQVDA